MAFNVNYESAQFIFAFFIDLLLRMLIRAKTTILIRNVCIETLDLENLVPALGYTKMPANFKDVHFKFYHVLTFSVTK